MFENVQQRSTKLIPELKCHEYCDRLKVLKLPSLYYRRARGDKDKKLTIPLYKAIVRLHLEYCIQAWRPYRKKDIDTLEHIQRRATKIIPELRDLSYEEHLTECGLTTLETRRLRGDQIDVFKILNGYENIDRNMLFSLKKDSRTRGHEVKLVKDQCRLDIRKYSFSQRTVNEHTC